jgi:carboxymethylenebutenolidase
MRLFAIGLFVVACGSPPQSNTPVTNTPVTNTPVSNTPAQPNSATAIELPGGGKGFLAVPPTPGKHPAIVVIQEWWGLNDWIRDQTLRFANKGYVALAVDLYRGKVASSPDEAHELSRGLPEDRAVADLEAGFGVLAARTDVDPARIGSIGWCMGGGYSLELATHEPKLRAAVINYGRLVTSPEKMDAIKASLLGNFGGADRGIAPADVRAFEAQMKERKKDVDIKIYEGAGHAFMNPNNKSGYVAADANDAWSRIDTFFSQKLGS